MSPEEARNLAVYSRRLNASSSLHSLHNPAELFSQHRREEATLRLLARFGRTDLRATRILDVGCARGDRLLDWLRWGAKADNLVGIDLMGAYLKQARALIPFAHLVQGSAERLPFPDEHFEIVTQGMLLSSILDEQTRLRISTEMNRVLAPGGLIISYDMRYPNPWNRNHRPVSPKDLEIYFPGSSRQSRSITLLPPLVRRLAPLSTTACRMLEIFLPFARSHYISIIEKQRRTTSS